MSTVKAFVIRSKFPRIYNKSMMSNADATIRRTTRALRREFI